MTFNETGLPSDLTWNVTLNGTAQNASTGSNITFDEPNGTYTYTLTGPGGYQVNTPAASGTVYVAGTSQTVVIPGIGAGNYPWTDAYDPANGYVYIVNDYSANVTVINGTTGKVVVSGIPVGINPYGIGYDAANGYLYVTSFWYSNVSIIDGASDKVVGAIGAGSEPSSVAYDAANNELYVTNFGDSNVTAINATSDKVVSPSIPAGFDVTGAAYDPENGYIYVADSGDNNGSVTIINGSTNKVVNAALRVGQEPYSIAYDAANGDLYVADTLSNAVTVIDGATNKVAISRIWVGTGPEGITYDETNGYLYVANSGSHNVTVINGATNHVVVAGIGVGDAPDGVAYDSADGYLYVASEYDHNVSVVNTNGLVASTWEGTPRYDVKFSDRGLPGGTRWWVNVTGQAPETSTTGSITLSLPDGNYTYVVSTADKTYEAAGGSFVVDGAPVSKSVAFTAVTFSVTFTESGLGNGTNWSVTFNGTTEITSTDSVTVNGSVNGTYAFSVANVAGYTVSPSNGSVTINGASQNESVVFATLPPGQYSVTFEEDGLPSGSGWGLTLDGSRSSSNTQSVVFTGYTNGSYAFQVSLVLGYTVSPSSGTITVNGASVSEQLNFSLVTYRVEFNESGLPNGVEWWVNATGAAAQNSTASSLTVAVENGTHTYSVASANSTYRAPGGTFTVAGTPVWINVTFTTVTYVVRFTESGLPNGTEWWVNVTDEPARGSTNATIRESLTNGSYTYAVSTANPTYEATGGLFAIDGSGVHETVTFSRVVYAVTFTETGLPNGTQWWVNGTSIGSQSSTTATVSFDEPNATYSYGLASADRSYAAIGGSFTVGGAEIHVSANFALVTFSVTFAETGLPSGDIWYVNLTGESPLAVDGTMPAIARDLPNGTYTFSVATNDKTWAPDYYTANFTVNGASVSPPAIEFARVTYGVAVTESGLPIGTSWSVTFDGVERTSNGAQIDFTEPNGTYSYSITPIAGYSTVYSGQWAVDGAASEITATFTQVTYTVTFTTSGLPSGVEWWVNVSGQPSASSTASVIALSLPNATYQYAVASGDSTYAGSAGYFTVAGGPAAEVAGFSLVTKSVTLTESGLPIGTAWWVNGSMIGSYRSSTLAISFDEPNGTYTYEVATADRDYAAEGGYFTVSGAAVPIRVEFVLVTYTVTFAQTGLPSGTNWSVTLGGVTYFSFGSSLVVAEPNASYDFAVGAVAGYAVDLSSGTILVNGAAVTETLTFRSTSPGSATFLGIPAIEGYTLLAGIVVAAAIVGLALILARRRRIRAAYEPDSPPPTGPDGPA